MTRLSWTVLIATAVGLGVALWTIGWVGLDHLRASVVRVGLGGFLAYASSSIVVLGALGAAWATATPGRDRPWHLFVWARAVREAANDLLPFSQLGGLLLGLRELADGGVRPASAYAATVVDLTTETASQIVLVIAGLLLGEALLRPAGASHLRQAIWLGPAVLVAVLAALVLLQRPALALAARLAARVVPASVPELEAARDELAYFGRRPAAFLPPFLWNMAAWLLSVTMAWLGLHLLGASLSFGEVLALEALISVLRSSAFLIPGALGVQEVGYVLLGGVVGLDHDTALAFALLKRGRDLALGVPILLILQVRLLVQRHTSPASAADPDRTI